jgi:hypothetical protein
MSAGEEAGCGLRHHGVLTPYRRAVSKRSDDQMPLAPRSGEGGR